MQLFTSYNPSITPDEDFVEVRECDYKGEHYSVRDNGAIMRHAKDRKRPNDNTWTFGRKDPFSGYMRFCKEPVHRIVATAFHGESPSAQHVVDHIDTNHCNNRPSNLRWLTKLENILLNETTRAKVEYICGSIEAFLANPQLLFGHESEDPNFAWMKAVTKEEANNTLANLEKLRHKTSSEYTINNGMGSWVYNKIPDQRAIDYSHHEEPNAPSKEIEKPYEPQSISELRFADGTSLDMYDEQPGWQSYETMLNEDKVQEPIEPEENEELDNQESNISEYFETSNKLALQSGWKPYTNPEFPCCPKEVAETPLQEYASMLEEGKDFVVASYGKSTVYKHTIYKNQLLVITKIPEGIKSFGLASVTWNGQAYIHESMGTFFEENGVLAAFTIAQDQEWDGPDSIDNYC